MIAFFSQCFLCVFILFCSVLLTLVCLMAAVAGGGEFISHSSCSGQLAGPNITKPYQTQLRKLNTILGGFFAATGKLPMHDCHWSASGMRKRDVGFREEVQTNRKTSWEISCVLHCSILGVREMLVQLLLMPRHARRAMVRGEGCPLTKSKISFRDILCFSSHDFGLVFYSNGQWETLCALCVFCILSGHKRWA